MEEEHLVVGAICACSPFYAKANIEELEFYTPNINLTQESMKSRSKLLILSQLRRYSSK